MNARPLLSKALGFAGPGDRSGDILFINSQPGKIGAHFVSTAPLEWTRDRRLCR
jgi:hypothetical protein